MAGDVGRPARSSASAALAAPPGASLSRAPTTCFAAIASRPSFVRPPRSGLTRRGRAGNDGRHCGAEAAADRRPGQSLLDRVGRALALARALRRAEPGAGHGGIDNASPEAGALRDGKLRNERERRQRAADLARRVRGRMLFLRRLLQRADAVAAGLISLGRLAVAAAETFSFKSRAPPTIGRRKGRPG
jgi:hypothetical protein